MVHAVENGNARWQPPSRPPHQHRPAVAGGALAACIQSCRDLLFWKRITGFQHQKGRSSWPKVRCEATRKRRNRRPTRTSRKAAQHRRYFHPARRRPAKARISRSRHLAASPGPRGLPCAQRVSWPAIPGRGELKPHTANSGCETGVRGVDAPQFGLVSTTIRAWPLRRRHRKNALVSGRTSTTRFQPVGANPILTALFAAGKAGALPYIGPDAVKIGSADGTVSTVAVREDPRSNH